MVHREAYTGYIPTMVHREAYTGVYPGVYLRVYLRGVHRVYLRVYLRVYTGRHIHHCYSRLEGSREPSPNSETGEGRALGSPPLRNILSFFGERRPPGPRNPLQKAPLHKAGNNRNNGNNGNIHPSRSWAAFSPFWARPWAYGPGPLRRTPCLPRTRDPASIARRT